MRFNPNDKTVDVDEIETLMDTYDSDGVFTTRKLYIKNFYIHIIKLIHCGHMMTFRDDNGYLRGFCSWILVDKESKKDINKVRWILPKEIGYGNILYIPLCLTTSTFMIHVIRNSLTEQFKDKVNEVFWFNVGRGKFFHQNVKGDIKCHNVAD